MLKKLKTISVITGLVLAACFVDAQKVGNGGHFNTAEAHRIFSKIILFLDFSLYAESSGIDSESIRNTKEIYDLNAQSYPGIGSRLYVLATTKDSREVCVVGSTQGIAYLLQETDNNKVVRFISQNLIRLDRLMASEKTAVVAELQRGKTDNFVGEHCVIQ